MPALNPGSAYTVGASGHGILFLPVSSPWGWGYWETLAALDSQRVQGADAGGA